MIIHVDMSKDESVTYKITSIEEFDNLIQGKSQIDNVSKILIKDITVEDSIRVPSIPKIQSIEFSSCVFKNYFECYSTEVDLISFEQCTFLGTTHFNSVISRRLLLNRCIFNTYTSIIFGTINRLEIDSTFSNLLIGDIKIDTLLFKSNISGQVVIEEGQAIEMLKFSNTIESSGEVNLKRSIVNHICFQNFTNHGILNLQNIKSGTSSDTITAQKLTSSFSLISANLGSATFLDFDFHSFDKICIENIKINNISIYGISFPANSRKIFTDNSFSEKKLDENKLYEFYNQLHVIMQRQGHRVNELLYYAEFMKWHLKDLWRKKKNWAMMTSLVLNKISTNYGKSWLQGAIGTFVIGWVFYFLYTISLPSVNISLDNANWNDTTFFIGEYFNFLNPAHRVDFMKGLPPNWIASIWDFLGRIAVGFMIYQTISAFRRFGIR